MRKNYIITLSLVLAVGIFCVLPIGAFLLDGWLRYQRDVDTLTSTAAKLGYNSNNHLNLFESHGSLFLGAYYNVIDLSFYSQDSPEQFTDKVKKLGFAQEYYFPQRQELSASFLAVSVNRPSSSKIVSLNNHYTIEDFNSGYPKPIVTSWELKDSQRRKFIIYYARPPSPQDSWLYDGKKLPGNVVVVELDRESVK